MVNGQWSIDKSEQTQKEIIGGILNFQKSDYEARLKMLEAKENEVNRLAHLQTQLYQQKIVTGVFFMTGLLALTCYQSHK